MGRPCWDQSQHVGQETPSPTTRPRGMGQHKSAETDTVCQTLSWVPFTSRKILQSTINSSNLLMSKLRFRLPWWLCDKESTCRCKRHRFDPWVRKISWRKKLQSTPVFLPGKCHEQKSLAGYSLWGCKESDTT